MLHIKEWVKRKVHRFFPKRFADLYDRYNEAMWYIFFGGLTTAVNFTVYLLLTRVLFAKAFAQSLEITVLWCNWGAWLSAVIAAFFFNRTFVFETQSCGKQMLWEFCTFFLMRLVSGALENTLPSVMIRTLSINDILAKAIIAVIIIIANYLFSKFISFNGTFFSCLSALCRNIGQFFISFYKKIFSKKTFPDENNDTDENNHVNQNESNSTDQSKNNGIHRNGGNDGVTSNNSFDQ